MPRPRTILLAALVPLALGLLAWNLKSQSLTAPPPPKISLPAESNSSQPPPTPLAPQGDGGGESRAYRSYAIALPKLRGLPPDAPPGTSFELWVAWGPPITRGPRVQKLIPLITLERVIPGISPEAPATAILRVRTADVDELMYADGYGSLGVAILP